MNKIALLKAVMLPTMVIFSFLTCSSRQNSIIVYPQHYSGSEQLAAKELRRYIYLRTGKLIAIRSQDVLPEGFKNVLLVGNKNWIMYSGPAIKKEINGTIQNLSHENYYLTTNKTNGKNITIIAGGDAQGTLYGAYEFAEQIGVRFYLHGDVIPDKKIAFKLPQLNKIGKPLFDTRGIQPFHDFPEGPDWWNVDDYKAIIAQLPKLKMNFFGLHTYPEGGVGPEPTVWIGLPADLQENGQVNFSYPARHFTTKSGTWGYAPQSTGDYHFGASQLFERDDYGAEYMIGKTPWPDSPEQCNDLFNKVGDALAQAFLFARALSIKTCVGTETPLVIPEKVKTRLKLAGRNFQDAATVQELYQGMFAWIKRNYPIDYYWFWTPEDWTWGGNSPEQLEQTKSDLAAAILAAKNVAAPFTLATCGWVLGPRQDRAMFDKFLPAEMPMSCINRQVGFAPVETGFARVKDRPKWAIPWLEDDPALTIPQLWVGRMRKDAADALSYGCTGLLGIHWRTRVLGPNVSALAKAAWDQEPWNPGFGEKLVTSEYDNTEGAFEASFADFSGTPVANTLDDSVYQKMIYNMDDFRMQLPNGNYNVTLKFCEFHHQDRGKRVFGITIQGRQVMEKLDIFDKVGSNCALDLTFNDVKVDNQWLHLHFNRIVEFPSLAAIAVTKIDVGTEQNKTQPFVRKINCGGNQYREYEMDPSLKLAGLDRPRDLSAIDFYTDWALTQFGKKVAEPLARIFARLDGSSTVADKNQRKANLPRPADWYRGPGGIVPDSRSWQEVSLAYEFVKEMEKLRPLVRGAGNLERFDYWLDNFQYLRALGKFNCTLYEFNTTMERLKAEQDSVKQKRLAKEVALPIRIKLMTELKTIFKYLLRTATTNGALGNVTNWQQHIIPMQVDNQLPELIQFLGVDLPVSALPAREFPAEPKMIVPTIRTGLVPGEALKLKIIVPGVNSIDGVLYWRSFGAANFNQVKLQHINRGVYTVTIAPELITEDFEYYIKAKSDSGATFTFPVTAPEICQTVVIMTNGALEK